MQIYDLNGYHLKGDKRIMFHMKHADLIDPGNNVVRGSDRDIAIILWCNMEEREKHHLWYDFGVNYNNSQV